MVWLVEKFVRRGPTNLKFTYFLVYTKTIKYPTVCPIYLIKWPFFDWSKNYINITRNSSILSYKLKYNRYQSSRGLSPKFSLVLKILAFKLRSIHFYLIKGPFFLFSTLKACKSYDSEYFETKSLWESFPIIWTRFWWKNCKFDNF